MHKTHIYKWTPQLAYAVGLITSDGSLSKDKRHIDFTSADLQLLKNFKTCLSLKNKISRKSNYHSPEKKYYHLQFSNVIFYKWLESIGLMPNKSKYLEKIKTPEKHFRDFLRGHLDGDGSVFTYKDRYMSYRGKRYTYDRLYTNFISTSHDHIEWIRSSLKRILNIQGALSSYLKKDRKVFIWQLRFARNDSIKLLQWLYYRTNLICLNRKMRVAKRFIEKCHH